MSLDDSSYDVNLHEVIYSIIFIIHPASTGTTKQVQLTL